MSSSYISSIRKKIGHDFLLLPSVTIIVFDENNRILMVRHSNGNVWVAPGGMVEPDETPSEAAKREMKEETGCEVELIGVFGSYGGPEFRIQYQNGDQVAYVMTVYEARILHGVIQPDGNEVQEVRFFTYDELVKQPTGKWVHVVLKDIFDRKPGGKSRIQDVF